METVDTILRALGAFGTGFTLLALVLPKGSLLGYWCGKLGADLTGHTTRAYYGKL